MKDVKVEYEAAGYCDEAGCEGKKPVVTIDDGIERFFSFCFLHWGEVAAAVSQEFNDAIERGIREQDSQDRSRGE